MMRRHSRVVSRKIGLLICERYDHHHAVLVAGLAEGP